MMRIVAAQGTDDLARVFVGKLDDGSLIEFAEALQPPLPRNKKWVLIVSSLKGCPVRCPICDAGGGYRGRLSCDEILAQVDHLIRRRFPNGRVGVDKLKVQFARMGDPAYNQAVLQALRALPSIYDAPGLMPCVSTIAPTGCDRFFDELLAIKNDLFSAGRFQLQFSLHTTCETARRHLIPTRTWSFEDIGKYGRRFVAAGDRKVTLNFAPPKGAPLDPDRLLPWFSPDAFVVKLTPINPTLAAASSHLTGCIDPDDPARCEVVAKRFRSAGFETILSIGEQDENRIGSNCGMRVRMAERSAAVAPSEVRLS